MDNRFFQQADIHPFRDENGRVSRLATALFLQTHGFQVPRYINQERLVEESKEDYYAILANNLEAKFVRLRVQIYYNYSILAMIE